MSTFFRGIKETIPSLFRGIFSERNSVPNLIVLQVRVYASNSNAFIICYTKFMFSRYFEYLLSYLKNIYQYLTFVIIIIFIIIFFILCIGIDPFPVCSLDTKKYQGPRARRSSIYEWFYCAIGNIYLLLQNTYELYRMCSQFCLGLRGTVARESFLSRKKCSSLSSQPEFVNLLRRPGINSQPGGPIRQPWLTYQAAGLHRPAEVIPWNRLLLFLKSLQIRALSFSRFSCSVSKFVQIFNNFITRYWSENLAVPFS
jgi:hypothetical protein